MGSEQSSQATNIQGSAENRVRVVQRQDEANITNKYSNPGDPLLRSSSPGPSICSDSDLPYISYTVNKPIGDSPKMKNRQSHITRGKSVDQVLVRRKSNTGNTLNRKTHNIVVVKPAKLDLTADKDQDLLRLRSIPMFLPIMRGTLNLPSSVRDPEILEKLDPIGLFNLCARYQHHLNTSAQLVASEQLSLVTDVDAEVLKLLGLANERQKQFIKFIEQLSAIHELSRQLTKCHIKLNETLESLETLNNFLPIKERLEPFIWTTG